MPLNVGIVDPSIITQGVRESKIDLATPVNMYTSLRADRRAQKLSELTLSKEEKSEKRAADLQRIIKGNLTPDGHMNAERLIPALNQSGFIDEANHISERMEKARLAKQAQAQEAEKVKIESQRRAGHAALAVLDSKDKPSAFLQFQKSAIENKLPISEDVKNYKLTDDEGLSGNLNPKISSYLDYLGNESLSPEQRLARMNEVNPDPTKVEYRSTPIYGKDKSGNFVAFQMSTAGGVKKIELPEGITLAPGFTKVEMGDKTGLVDKSGKVFATIPKVIDPGKKADLGLKGEVLVLKKEEAAQKAVEFEAEKVEIAKKARAYDQKNKESLSSIQRFLDLAKETAENPNMTYTTGKGALLKYNPGSEAANLQADIDKLVASGVLETMANLKDQSPTGATGFGAMDKNEMGTIKSAFSSLSNNMISPEKKVAELKYIIKIMEKREREHRRLMDASGGLLGPDKSEEEQFNEELKSNW